MNAEPENLDVTNRVDASAPAGLRIALFVGCIALALAVSTWMMFREPGGSEPAMVNDDAAAETAERPQDVAASGAADSPIPAARVADEPIGGPRSSLSSAADPPMPAARVADDPTGGPRSSFEANIQVVSDPAHWARLPPLEQIVTATSIQDWQWMRRNLYPTLRDIEDADLARLEAIVRNSDVRSQRDAVFFAANVLAARLYRDGDPRWKDYADRSTGPFPTELRLMDALAEFDATFHSLESGRRLMHAMAFAQVMGLVDVTKHFEGFRGVQPAISALEYASLIEQYARLLEHQNWYFQRWGLTPVRPGPRPAPPWRGGPCPPGRKDC